MPYPTQEEIIWMDLPHTNGLQMKCLLQGDLDRPVALMLHGKPGRPDGIVQGQTSSFFNDLGITTLRPYLYSPDPTTRKLEDCTLEQYTHDFETAVAYLRTRNVPKIFGIGHSYGGLAILNSKITLDAAVLWEPTHGSYWVEYPGLKRSTQIPLTEYETMGDTTALAAHKGYPLKIISAGKGSIVKFHERYIAVADEPKAHSVIPGARHTFGESLQSLHALRQQTADWLVQCL